MLWLCKSLLKVKNASNADGNILLKYRNMNKAVTFSLFIWSKGKIDSSLKIGGVWSVKPANDIIPIIFFCNFFNGSRFD